MQFDYEWFKKKIWEYIGINLSYYEEKQMKRRIESLMKKKTGLQLLQIIIRL